MLCSVYVCITKFLWSFKKMQCSLFFCIFGLACSIHYTSKTKIAIFLYKMLSSPLHDYLLQFNPVLLSGDHGIGMPGSGFFIFVTCLLCLGFQFKLKI